MTPPGVTGKTEPSSAATTGSAGPPRRRRVVVVGAGLTGLAAAWHLRDDLDVTVVEASDRVGGEIRTIDLAGARFDVGADAFLARQPEAEQLARAAGFGDEDLVAPATSDVGLWIDGRRRPLPDGTVLGAPTDPVALARSGVLGPGAILRAMLEPVLPRRRLVGDRSVADLVAERFGQQVVDRLVEPLLGGVYAGRADRLSAEVAAAPIWAAATGSRSVLLGLARQRARSAGDDRPVFLTIRGGLGRLVERLADDLGDRVRTASPVVGVARAEGGGYEVTVDDGSVLTADSVVLAVPAPAAAELLAPLCPEAARELAGIPTASVGVVALAYPRAAGTVGPRGSGVLVPPSEGRVVKAVTFASNKWPHHADHEHILLRASVGRVDDDRVLELPEEHLVSSVDREVREMTGLTGSPVAHHVQRWPRGLPQYEVGHRARIDRIRHALRVDAPSLLVGGAAFDGVGLAARARDAARLAHELRDASGR